MPNKRAWLINFREKAGFTQEEVANLCNLPRSTYAQYEVGRRNPTVENAQKIGNALGFNWPLFFNPQCRNKRQSPDVA